ncbi:PREDICTED: uncharacterized protein LOC106814150 [Priapulus caudatus]|uniref:Uncharacterized protein LOC106814150 n=1 Tax=Priapulus caudatus TaxID=37621 RepID=A0ABM1EP08_PRICU|nr:PREDICTED: uncharacterized protein LOC106814150 [Priapulus caudatus]
MVLTEARETLDGGRVVATATTTRGCWERGRPAASVQRGASWMDRSHAASHDSSGDQCVQQSIDLDTIPKIYEQQQRDATISNRCTVEMVDVVNRQNREIEGLVSELKKQVQLALKHKRESKAKSANIAIMEKKTQTLEERVHKFEQHGIDVTWHDML